tara:strand:- start:44 stop:274 length:231 start_codon:yes stop_codon:yes gene_type:complete
MLQGFKLFFEFEDEFVLLEFVLVELAITVTVGIPLRDSIVPAQASPVAVPIGDYGAAAATLCTSATGGEEGEGAAH